MYVRLLAKHHTLKMNKQKNVIEKDLFAMISVDIHSTEWIKNVSYFFIAEIATEMTWFIQVFHYKFLAAIRYVHVASELLKIIKTHRKVKRKRKVQRGSIEMLLKTFSHRMSIQAVLFSYKLASFLAKLEVNQKNCLRLSDAQPD